MVKEMTFIFGYSERASAICVAHPHVALLLLTLLWTLAVTTEAIDSLDSVGWHSIDGSFVNEAVNEKDVD